MKKNIYVLFAISMLMILGSCNDDTSQDKSKITHFITFDLTGGSVMTVPVGGSFSDPGVVAKEGTKDVSSKVKETGAESVDPNKIGVYFINYSATNVDGFSSSAMRTVIVYDPSDVNTTKDISGKYTLTKSSHRGSTTFSGQTVTIREVAPGFFYVSDFFGGFYDQLRAYGSTFAMTGYVQLHADNSLSCLYSYMEYTYWQQYLDDFSGKYDSSTGIISWDADWSGYVFSIFMK